MELVTRRLRLSPLGPALLESTYAYAADPENTRYMVFYPVQSREELLTFLQQVDAEWKREQPSFYELAIWRQNQHIGAISLYWDETKTTGELGWILHPQYHGHGYATEAAQAVMAFAMETRPLIRFIAHCDSENIPSTRVMEKLGMTRIACEKGRKNRSSEEERWEYTYEYRL